MMNQELLSEALEAGKAISTAERNLELATEKYCQRIRRLHLSGASVREIAQAVNLSHQRVHQLVSSAASGWRDFLRAIPKHTATEKLMNCGFCGADKDSVEALIAGPSVFICDDCTKVIEHVMIDQTKSAPNFQALERTSKLRCSFCSKRSGRDRNVVAGVDAQICHECIEICKKLLKEYGIAAKT